MDAPSERSVAALLPGLFHFLRSEAAGVTGRMLGKLFLKGVVDRKRLVQLVDWAGLGQYGARWCFNGW